MADKKTKLDKDTTKPSTTQPGDGPADTTDPNERASSRPPDPKDEAHKVGTVNAVVSVETPSAPQPSGKPRTEEYEATRPDGTTVTVERNVETGESSVKGK